jgi:hypothetical protein
MAEEFIYCPNCSHKLRVPEELLGQIVQCPMCKLVFTSPTRASSSPRPEPPVIRDEPESAPAPVSRSTAGGWVDEPADQGRVKALLLPPAICLLITGILGLLIDLFQVVMAIAAPQFFKQPELFGPPPPQEMAVVMNIGSGVIFGVISIVIILAAVQMMMRRAYVLSMIGSVLAIINIGNCCCVLGLPFGIWSLIVLCQPGVRDAFE